MFDAMALNPVVSFDPSGHLPLTYTDSIHCNKTGIAKDRNWLVEPSELSVRGNFVAPNRNNMSKGCRESV